MEILPSPTPRVSRIRRYFAAGLAVAGAILATVFIFFILSFISSSKIQVFQKDLEKGVLENSPSAGNPLRFLQVSWRYSAVEKFKQAVENYDGDLEPLQKSYPGAVAYLAYNPHSAEILSLIARYYFIQGSRLPAESLSLTALSLNPYDFTARRGPVLCQALHSDQRERLLAGTWAIIGMEEQVLKYFIEAKGKEKALIYLGQFLGRFLAKKESTPIWENIVSLSKSKNEEKLNALKKEENWIKYQYAFGLFLTDPLRWKEDARDCLDDEAVKADPLNLEYQCVVNAWVAEWMEDRALIAASKGKLEKVKLANPLAQKRLLAFTTAFEAVKGYDKQMEALKVYDCDHPVDPVWTRLENDALQLSEEFQPPSPEQEGGNDSREWLGKIASGQESPAPGRTKEDYVYPQFAEVKKIIDDSLKKTVMMPVCPVVMPLRDGQGRHSPLGAYLSVQAMTLASFPGKQVLSFWAPYSAFKDWSLLGHSGLDRAGLAQELMAKTGAASSAEGTLLSKAGGWEVTLRFKGGSKSAAFTKGFKKNQLHLIPGWMAGSLHKWMGTRLSKAQKARLRKPIFNDDESLQRGVILENFGFETNQSIPGWDKICGKNPKSSFVLFRDFHTQEDIVGVKNLKPLETLVKKDPQDDLAKFFMASLYQNESMYGKSLNLNFKLLAKDQANPGYFSNISGALESLGDYANARYLYEKMAARFPENAQVQEALGSFYVDYAWIARGGGWADSVSSWNGFLFEKRLALARKYLEKAMTLNPQDSRIYSGLLQVGKGQGWKKEELDKIFNQSVSIDPDYYPSYQQRLDMTMEKWGGSNDEMMEFARKWQSRQPWLMVQALEEKAGNQTDGKDLEYYRYLASPKVWPDFNGAYQSYFTNVSMDDYSTWVLYAYSAAKTDKLKDFLSFLRTQSEKDEILRNFNPYLVNLAYAYRAQAIGWEHVGQLYLNTKDVWPEIYGATLQVLKQDPDNYAFLNTQAISFTGWGRFKSARKIFEAIGGHWIPKSGTKEQFDRYKRIAYLKEAPTWHLCLSTAELAAER